MNQTGTEDLLQGVGKHVLIPWVIHHLSFYCCAQELLGIVGTTLSMNSSATIYSIQVLNTTISRYSDDKHRTYINNMKFLIVHRAGKLHTSSH